MAEEYKQNIIDAGVEIIEVDANEWADAMSPVYDTWVGQNGIEADMITKIQEAEDAYFASAGDDSAAPAEESAPAATESAAPAAE